MIEFISCFLVAIALSMDTFSLSLGIGTYNIIKKDIIKLSIIVGIMHFFMPLLGNLLGTKVVNFFALNSNKLLGIILLFLAINLIYSLKKDEKIDLDLSLSGMLLFAFGVSIDAFSTGLGLKALTNNTIMALSIFSLSAFSFTIFGLILGKIASQKLGQKASYIGLILLITLAIHHLCL